MYLLPCSKEHEDIKCKNQVNYGVLNAIRVPVNISTTFTIIEYKIINLSSNEHCDP